MLPTPLICVGGYGRRRWQPHGSGFEPLFIMKKLIEIIMCAVPALILAIACSGPDVGSVTPVDEAEDAFAHGRYAKAQNVCDSIVLGPSFADTDVWDLCRLSLLLVRLGESTGDNDVNTAFAVRCLRAAIQRDSDSTSIYIQAMPNEDRARMMILSAINEASHDAPEEEPDFSDGV